MLVTIKSKAKICPREENLNYSYYSYIGPVVTLIIATCSLILELNALVEQEALFTELKKVFDKKRE